MERTMLSIFKRIDFDTHLGVSILQQQQEREERKNELVSIPDRLVPRIIWPRLCMGLLFRSDVHHICVTDIK